MSVGGPLPADGPDLFAGYPMFDLRYCMDNPDQPTEMTVFPRTPRHDLTTEWITIDPAHAVSIDDAR